VNPRLRRRLLVLLLFAPAMLAWAMIDVTTQTPPSVPLTVLSREGRRTLPLVLVNNQEFVAVDDLAATFDLAMREDALGALAVAYKDKTIVLTNQALASVSGRLVSLPAPATRVGRRWLVPVEFISRALSLVYDAKLELRKPAHLLIVGDLRVPRITVRYDILPPGGRLTIDAAPRANSTVTQGNDRLSIKFEADALDVDPMPLAAQPPASLVQTVRLIDATTLEVVLGPRVAGFRATSLPIETTMRLAVDVVAAPADAVAAAPPTAPLPGDLPPSLAPPASPLQTVVIDPGHGGDDRGVAGAGGAREKDLTMAVARRLKAAIEGRLGVRVLLTRDDDRDVPIDDRTSVANNNKADLFISLHVDASFKPEMSGATIYYAAFDGPTANATLGGIERVPTFSGGTRDIELVAWDLAQTHHLDQSMAFATILETRLRDHVALTPQPIARAPLAVLEPANMPAVSIEMGFLSNPQQEKQLAGADFQATFVQAVTDAIITFRDSLPAVRR
jgi:N-acetylmuramoyl-L-alanine amidase